MIDENEPAGTSIEKLDETNSLSNNSKKSEATVKINEKALKSTEVEMTEFHLLSNDFRTVDFCSLEENNLHCPFRWRDNLNTRFYEDHDIDLLSDYEEMFEEIAFTFKRCIIHLNMCYQNFYKRLIEKSINNLEQLENMLQCSTSEECNDELLNLTRTALLHVAHSSRVYILAMTNQNEIVSQILPKIKSYKSMNNEDKAAIWGIRAAIYVQYGFEGVIQALEYINDAIKLDPKNAYWHFHKGLYLNRKRRMEKKKDFKDVSAIKNEIESLQKANALYENPVFLSYIAEVYMEMAENFEEQCKLNNNNSNVYKTAVFNILHQWNTQTAEFFKKSVQMRPCSAHLLIRCGRGHMKLPAPFQDLELARKLLQDGLEISPTSSIGNHAMATYMENHEKDYNAAEEFLEKAIMRKNFRAYMDLCRLRYLIENDIADLIKLLNRALNSCKEIPRRCEIYGELICCYLFMDYDLQKVCQYAKELIQSQTVWIDYIHEFKSSIFPFTWSIPLIEIIVIEIQRVIHHKDISEKEKDIYKNFYKLIDLENVSLPKNMRKNILCLYLEDLTQAFLKQRRILTVNPPHRNRRRSSSEDKNCKLADDDYRKLYYNSKEESVNELLLSSESDNEQYEMLRRHRVRTRERDISENRSTKGNSEQKNETSRQENSNLEKSNHAHQKEDLPESHLDNPESSSERNISRSTQEENRSNINFTINFLTALSIHDDSERMKSGSTEASADEKVKNMEMSSGNISSVSQKIFKDSSQDISERCKNNNIDSDSNSLQFSEKCCSASSSIDRTSPDINKLTVNSNRECDRNYNDSNLTCSRERENIHESEKLHKYRNRSKESRGSRNHHRHRQRRSNSSDSEPRYSSRSRRDGYERSYNSRSNSVESRRSRQSCDSHGDSSKVSYASRRHRSRERDDSHSYSKSKSYSGKHKIKFKKSYKHRSSSEESGSSRKSSNMKRKSDRSNHERHEYRHPQRDSSFSDSNSSYRSRRRKDSFAKHYNSGNRNIKSTNNSRHYDKSHKNRYRNTSNNDSSSSSDSSYRSCDRKNKSERKQSN